LVDELPCTSSERILHRNGTYQLNVEILFFSYCSSSSYYSTINHSLTFLSLNVFKGHQWLRVFTSPMSRMMIDIVFPYFWYLLMEMCLCLQTPTLRGLFRLKGRSVFFLQENDYICRIEIRSMCVFAEFEYMGVDVSVCVCVCKREREKEYVCLCMCMFCVLNHLYFLHFYFIPYKTRDCDCY